MRERAVSARDNREEDRILVLAYRAKPQSRIDSFRSDFSTMGGGERSRERKVWGRDKRGKIKQNYRAAYRANLKSKKRLFQIRLRH